MIFQRVIHLINPNTMTALVLIGIIPFIFRNREPCYDDNDCPFFMKCCILGIEKYCCTPNNYVKYEPIYLYKSVKNN